MKTYIELKKMWTDYFREKQHAIIPSASVVPENDPSTIFTTAGMQSLCPYLLGERHPGGKRIANIQRCIRTGDIDEVGDDTHLTFFEMMGNWSLGDYFKAEKVKWSFELLTSPKYLGLDSSKIHVTCFEGDAIAPRDTECANHWESVGIPKERIHFLPKSENWWNMASGLGPQGSCSEMFFDNGAGCGKSNCNPSCDCGRFTELGNDVYMQYIVDKAGDTPKLASQKNVDTGWGLERVLCFVNGYRSVYDSELFVPAIEILKKAGVTDTRAMRIIAEHTRAACVIIADGINPSNSGAGYVLRRLIRRAVRNANKYGLDKSVFVELVKFYNSYLEFDEKLVADVFIKEVDKFEKTLANGLKEFEKLKTIDGKVAFYLYETFGFPIELTVEMAAERGIKVSIQEYNKAKEEHTEKSRAASVAAGAFKGGLADSCVETIKLHTAAHILMAVLKQNLGDDVNQKGSNITAERLRFDFNYKEKLLPEVIAKIEKEVNEIISQNLDVRCEEMSVTRAREIGATGAFLDKYGDVVKVYIIGKGGNHLTEICGGPHVSNTRELWVFKIQKEEGVGAGVRRIKAVLSNSAVADC